ncbi:hypothetical protein A3A93_00165 [Candidatus Roizmanbacteria bacterium RIFCSPLOWO2_01_FULL_38_12]|uniref:UDP-N-acetylmuramyl-tripeptide synthetase n=1 Tax=Candidatus Roizmanbacteria bacterium RIFCSPLOWO2_01_FULL_38_12 TaxID=1802061 RepID=A0A1F7ITH9_9BACT|nr:MAG: hypothetical protein A3A93_00165 [Candidatus Roizmanbacteria bacterium RIFCSPLOWO2_01_FULL_38_12]
MNLQSIKNIYHFILSFIANIIYDFPSRKLIVVGVTGTDGKTTTSSLIYHILNKVGKKASVITSVSAVIGNKTYDTGFHVTTPGPLTVQKYLKQAVDDGSEYFVLETTSHALDQYRVYGINYAIGLLTNITHEHLHYHKTYEKYVKAKAKLLKWSKLALINRDDKSYEIVHKLCHGNCKTYGLEYEADYNIDIAKKNGLDLAQFNKYNYLGAYTVCHELGLSDEEIFSAMKTFKLPKGRMEVIYTNGFKVIVDFAHTPNGLHEALNAIKQLYKPLKIIHVFGAAAFRDDAKRPIMGDESASHADTTILTEEDYRTEDPNKICREIAAGLLKNKFRQEESDSYNGNKKTFTVIIDRKKAIEKALSIVKSNDVIVLTGKGHEQSLCRGTKEYPWDDKKTVLEIIRKLRVMSYEF